jgi:hypothetical protein
MAILTKIEVIDRPLSVLSQQNAGNILAGIGVDHHEINLAFRPVVNLIEAMKIELLVNQDRPRVDGGPDEFKPHRFASSLCHTCSAPVISPMAILPTHNGGADDVRGPLLAFRHQEMAAFWRGGSSATVTSANGPKIAPSHSQFLRERPRRKANWPQRYIVTTLTSSNTQSISWSSTEAFR